MKRERDAIGGWLERLGALVLIALMLVTCLDVFGRYFFSNPLHGGHVIVQILVSILVFLGISLLVRDDEFIKVELVNRHLSERARTQRDRLVAIVITVFLVLLSGQLIWQSFYFSNNGEYFESIRIPVSWVAIFASIATVVATGFSVGRCKSMWRKHSRQR